MSAWWSPGPASTSPRTGCTRRDPSTASSGGRAHRASRLDRRAPARAAGERSRPTDPFTLAAVYPRSPRVDGYAFLDDDAASCELDDRRCTRAHVERLEDRTDVHLVRSFGQAQVSADQLVGLTLDQQPQHVRLPMRQAER